MQCSFNACLLCVCWYKEIKCLASYRHHFACLLLNLVLNYQIFLFKALLGQFANLGLSCLFNAFFISILSPPHVLTSLFGVSVLSRWRRICSSRPEVNEPVWMGDYDKCSKALYGVGGLKKQRINASPFTVYHNSEWFLWSPDAVLTQISKLDVSEHVEAALLNVVDEGDEADGAARIGDHQQDLRPPELHVVLSHVQHQQVLADLVKGWQ